MDKAYAHRVGNPFIMAAQAEELTREQLAARMQLLGCDMTRSALAKYRGRPAHALPRQIKALRTALSVTYDDILFVGELTQLRIRILRCPDRRQWWKPLLLRNPAVRC